MLHKMVRVFPQVTFDVTWSPKCKDRCYNYTGIADACDFLFVMSYDEQSPALSECIAAANAPYKETLTGKNPPNDHFDIKVILVFLNHLYTFSICKAFLKHEYHLIWGAFKFT